MKVLEQLTLSRAEDVKKIVTEGGLALVWELFLVALKAALNAQKQVSVILNYCTSILKNFFTCDAEVAKTLASMQFLPVLVNILTASKELECDLNIVSDAINEVFKYLCEWGE